MQLGEFAELAIGVDYRAFVGADGMSAGFERRFDVADGRLAVVAIERTGFEKNVGLGSMEPFTNVCRLRRCRRRPMVIQRVFRVQAIGIGDPADAARRDAGEFPGDCVVPLEDFFFGGDKADEFLTDVAESDESEIICANRILLRGEAVERARSRAAIRGACAGEENRDTPKAA